MKMRVPLWQLTLAIILSLGLYGATLTVTNWPRRAADAHAVAVETPHGHTLKRIVWLSNDISRIGGIPRRYRNLAEHTAKFPRSIEHVIAVRRHMLNVNISKLHVHDANPRIFHKTLRAWSDTDTVFIAPYVAIGAFPNVTADIIMAHPVMYMGAGQMSRIVLQSRSLLRSAFARNFQVSGSLSFSRSDINFMEQLGVYGHTKTFPPVAQRETNTFDVRRNIYVGYVGRAEFPTKGVDRLIDVARVMKQRNLGPMKIFTTNGSALGSPDFSTFMRMAKEAKLTDMFDITFNASNADEIYDDIKVLLVPSRMEASSNTALEAMSRGIPIIAPRHAAGPADLITHCKNGLLLDEYTGNAVVDGIEELSGPRLQEYSHAAFLEHKLYTMEAYLSVVEAAAQKALDLFHKHGGKNFMRIFPELSVTYSENV